MFVPAMAFAWCVLSAEAAETQSPPRSSTAIAAPSPRRAPVAPVDALAPPAPAASATPAGPVDPREQRTPIRSAIPLEVIAFAKTLVNLPMGAEQIKEIGGQRYVFVLERHYHPPGFVGAPVGFHKGVTAYELH